MNNGMRLITEGDFCKACKQFSQYVEAVKVMRDVLPNLEKKAGNTTIVLSVSEKLSKKDRECLLTDLRTYLYAGTCDSIPGWRLHICMEQTVLIHSTLWVREAMEEGAMSSLHAALAHYIQKQFVLSEGKRQFERFFAMRKEGVSLLCAELNAQYPDDEREVQTDLEAFMPDCFVTYRLGDFCIKKQAETVYEAKYEPNRASEGVYHRQYHEELRTLRDEIVSVLGDAIWDCKTTLDAKTLSVVIWPKGKKISDARLCEMKKSVESVLPIGLHPDLVVAKEQNVVVSAEILIHAYYEDAQKQIQGAISNYLREAEKTIGAVVRLQELYDVLYNLKCVVRIKEISIGFADEKGPAGRTLQLRHDAVLKLAACELVLLTEEV